MLSAVHENGSGTMAEINTTPLIDVMLVLLVMLILTIPVQMHAVRLNMPAQTPQTLARPRHTVTIDFDGAIAWDGRDLSSPNALDAYFRAVAREPVQDDVLISPNRLARYDAIAKIMASAQRLGVKRVGIAGEEQYLR